MINLTWEQIEHDHACHIFRARIPAGWLVLYTEDVYHGEFLLGSHTPNDLRGWDWRSSITFVPDPDHRWGSPKRPDDASTPSTASTSSHALDETADIDHLRTTLFKANKTIDKQAGQIARLKAELERFRSVIKEADIEDPDEGVVYYGRFDEDGHYQPPDRLPNIRRLEKQIARLKDELKNQRNREPCPNCDGGALLYDAHSLEYQCTNCAVRFPDCHTLRSQLAEAEKWKEPRLKKEQPCGCIVCTCEDPVQCHGCGAKECGQPDCVFFCGVPTSSAEWEPHPLVQERDKLLVEIQNESVNRETWHREAAALRDAISKLKARIRDLKELQSASPSARDKIRALETELEHKKKTINDQAGMLQNAHAQLTKNAAKFERLATLLESTWALLDSAPIYGVLSDRMLEWTAKRNDLLASIGQIIRPNSSTPSTPSTEDSK